MVLGKPFAGQEECTCVQIKKLLFRAKFQAAIKTSFHSSSTPLPKQINERVLQLPAGQGWILQAHPSQQPLASTGSHRGSMTVLGRRGEKLIWKGAKASHPMTGVPTFPIPSLAVYLLISQAVILPSQAGLEWNVAVCPLRLLVAASHYCHIAEVFVTFVQAQQLDFGSIPGTSTNVTQSYCRFSQEFQVAARLLGMLAFPGSPSPRLEL